MRWHGMGFFSKIHKPDSETYIRDRRIRKCRHVPSKRMQLKFTYKNPQKFVLLIEIVCVGLAVERRGADIMV